MIRGDILDRGRCRRLGASDDGARVEVTPPKASIKGEKMGAGHAHGSPQGTQNTRRIALVLALAAVYMVAEVIGGWLTGSLALLADAGHMLSDVAALGLSLFALWVAKRPPTPARSFGYYRTEILAALVNGATLVAVAIYVFVEAAHRFGRPPEVQGALMMGIATGGLVVNLLGLWILNAGKSESLNVRGAWLHVLTDMLGSVGAIAAGVLIWAFGWQLADPIASVLIGMLVLYSSWALLKEVVGVLMEWAPGHLDMDAVRDAIAGVRGVHATHDLHVWTITSGLVALSVHVLVAPERDSAEALRELRQVLQVRFHIDHATIQIEPVGFEECGPEGCSPHQGAPNESSGDGFR